VKCKNLHSMDREVRQLEGGDLAEEMYRQFEFLRDEIKGIIEAQEQMDQEVKQICSMFGIKPLPKETVEKLEKGDSD